MDGIGGGEHLPHFPEWVAIRVADAVEIFNHAEFSKQISDIRSYFRVANAQVFAVTVGNRLMKELAKRVFLGNHRNPHLKLVTSGWLAFLDRVYTTFVGRAEGVL
jgi:hypothetical protein